MATLGETRMHATEPLVGPAGYTRFAILLVLGVAVVVGIALSIEQPTAPDAVQSAPSVPSAARTYDGRGKWTGY